MLLKKIKFLLIVFLTTISISLLIDFLFGKKILNLLDPFLRNSEFYERLIRIDHKVYHHGLRKNSKYKKMRGFNGLINFCTDNHGFKYNCKDIIRGKKFDFAFIGDSFTEGIGLNYEETFAGVLEQETTKTIANLGVVSYSPSIYLSKINYFLKEGYKFNHIIVMIDVSDLYDDNFYYVLNNDLTVSTNFSRNKSLKRKEILRSFFPLTNFYAFILRSYDKKNKINNKTLKPSFAPHQTLKASWTYSKNDKIIDITSISRAQIDMINKMEQLHKLLKKNSIKMSLAVYPWPQQLKHDVVYSKHVKMWEEFCFSRCNNFINFFPTFFDKKKESSFIDVYKKYYFWNDVNFNKEGNKLLADKLIKIIEK